MASANRLAITQCRGSHHELCKSNMPLASGITEDENGYAPAGDRVSSSLVPQVGVNDFA